MSIYVADKRKRKSLKNCHRCSLSTGKVTWIFVIGLSTLFIDKYPKLRLLTVKSLCCCHQIITEPLRISPHTAVMSIEYTIDIQLTELGFPDILQPQETSVRETSRRSTSDGSFSSSHSTTRKQKLLVKGLESVDEEKDGAAKQISNIQQTTVDSPPPESLPCKPISPAQSLEDDQAVEGTAVSELSKPTKDDPTARLESTDSPQPTTAEEEDGQKDNGDGDKAQEGSAEMEQDSDDSEVSEVYEEEEVDEEDEDEEEEGLDDGTTHSLGP